MNPNHRIEQLEQEIALMEGVEDTARKRLSGQDPEWNSERDRMMERMCGLITAFKIEDPPHKAVNILGQLLADAHKLQAPRKIVDDIDNKRKMLHALLAERERLEMERRLAQEDFDERRRQAI